MKVTIRALDGEGEDRIVGAIQLSGKGGIILDPPSDRLLLNIVATPIADPTTGEMIESSADPKAFLAALQHRYRSPYLRASKPEGGDE